MKRSGSESYYWAHRSEVLAADKRRREANLELYRERGREASRRWRDLHPEVYRERHKKYLRRWRDSHRDMFRAIDDVQKTVPLGDCCELCGSVDNLMRFLPDYEYRKVVVTICRRCRIWARSSLKSA